MPASSAATQPAIFLSYGRKDAQELAERLHADLSARGFRIWQDIERIRTGWNWDEEIERGLRESQLLLALLSPHSVRRAGTAGNADDQDSVCLDEIAYARGVCRMPIVPVFAAPCQSPLLIYRTQAVDMTRSGESPALYEAGLAKLCDHLAAAMRGERRERVDAGSPDPWDFALFLVEKRRGFTGREWLLTEIDEWRRRPGSPALLVTGDPGVGKSAVVAELVASNPGGQVLAYHCCQADTPVTLGPGRFVRSLAGMLAMRLDSYAAMLGDPGVQEALSESRASTDPGGALEAGVLAPLHRLTESQVREVAPNGACYLLIDALDEALTLQQGVTIVDVLASRLQRFPPWLRVVATTRNDRGVLQRLSGLHAHTIQAQDPRNLDDVRAYVRRRLASPGLAAAVEAAGAPRDRLAETLLTASGGNFLFVTKVLDAVEARQLTLAHAQDLPPGLGSLYRMFFTRLFPDPEQSFAQARVVLQVLAASREPLGRTQLAVATGIDAEDELPGVLGRLAAFIPQRDGRYALFHKSLYDWLAGWDADLDQPAAGEFFANPKKGHARLAAWCSAELERGVAATSVYVLRHAAHHLAAAARHDALASLLMDWRFLEATAEGARGSGTTVFDLIASLATGAEALPTEHPGRRRVALLNEAVCFDAHLIARHPTALFQCCWNRCWWYDSPGAAHFFEPPDEPPADPDAPWRREGEKLHTFMEAWRAAKEQAMPGFVWMRSLRPLPDRIGSAQRVVIQAHEKGRIHLAVSPEETRLVSGGEWGSIRLWDLRSGAPVAAFDAGSDQASNGLAFLRSENLILSSSYTGRFLLLDAANLSLVEQFKVDGAPVTSMALASDGRLVAVCHDDGQLTLVDLPARGVLARGRRVEEGNAERFSTGAVAFSPDGQELLVEGKAAGDCLWRFDVSASDLRPIEAIPTAAPVEDVAYSPDGRTIAWAVSSGAIFVRAREGGAPWSVQITAATGSSIPAPVSCLSFSTDSTRLFYGAGDVMAEVEAEVGLLNLATQEVERRLYGHSSAVLGLVAYRNGRGLVSSGHDSTIRQWSLDPEEATLDLPWYERQVSAVRFAQDGRLVFTASKSADTVIARDVDSGAIAHLYSGHDAGATKVAVSPDSHRLATGDGQGVLRVWDVAGGEPIAIGDEMSGLSDLRFSPDGRILAATGYAHARLYDAGTGRRLVELGAEGASIKSFAFSGDGRLLAAVSSKTLWIADAHTGDVVREIHRDRYWPDDNIALSHDGAALVARLWSGAVEALSTVTGEEVPAPAELEQRLDDSCSPFAWNLGRERERDLPESQQRLEMELCLRRDARPIAWIPVPWTHDLVWHPSGRAWALEHYRQLFLFRLEGDCGA